MPAFTEARIQRFLDHAQRSLLAHEHYDQARDPAYHEVLEFVDEVVELLMEVRKERAALQQIAGMWDELDDTDDPFDPAVRMCGIARRALGIAREPSSPEAEYTAR